MDGFPWEQVFNMGFPAVMSVVLIFIVDRRLVRISEDLRESITMLRQLCGEIQHIVERGG